MTSEIPSPILIFGDPYTSKNYLVSTKKKYPNIKWVTKSATNDTIDNIRAEAGIVSWDDSIKVLVIQDIPDRTQVRDFLSDLAETHDKNTKIIIWDSNQHIKIDPKEKTIEKTWAEFVDRFKSTKGSKIVNSGEQFTEKNEEDTVTFITNQFLRYNKQISSKNAKLLISIVGRERSMLDSDIKKMVLTAPEVIDADFIIDNAFPSTKEAIIYKLGNALDGNSYEATVNMVERFLANDVNYNVIAEICVKKARWQLAVAYMWSQGVPFSVIPNKLMEMGKFPSVIWHNEEMSESEKRSMSEGLQEKEEMRTFLNRKMGISDNYFKAEKEKKGKSKRSKGVMARKGAEVIPMFFMASQTVDFIKDRVVGNNKITDDLKKKVLNRGTKVYLFVQEKLADIRYGNNPNQDLQEMIRVLMNTNLSAF